MANNPPPTQLAYSDGDFLTAQDFTDEQNYHIEKLQLHNKYVHTSGIGSGLVVSAERHVSASSDTVEARVEAAQSQNKNASATRKTKTTNVASTDAPDEIITWTVEITAGLAIDANGNEIFYDGADPAPPDLPKNEDGTYKDGDYLLTIAYNTSTSQDTPNRIFELPELVVISSPPPAGFKPSMTLELAKITIASGNVTTDPSGRVYSTLQQNVAATATSAPDVAVSKKISNQLSALQKSHDHLKKQVAQQQQGSASAKGSKSSGKDSGKLDDAKSYVDDKFKTFHSGLKDTVEKAVNKQTGGMLDTVKNLKDEWKSKGALVKKLEDTAKAITPDIQKAIAASGSDATGKGSSKIDHVKSYVDDKFKSLESVIGDVVKAAVNEQTGGLLDTVKNLKDEWQSKESLAQKLEDTGKEIAPDVIKAVAANSPEGRIIVGLLSGKKALESKVGNLENIVKDLSKLVHRSKK